MIDTLLRSVIYDIALDGMFKNFILNFQEGDVDVLVDCNNGVYEVFWGHLTVTDRNLLLNIEGYGDMAYLESYDGDFMYCESNIGYSISTHKEIFKYSMKLFSCPRGQVLARCRDLMRSGWGMREVVGGCVRPSFFTTI